MAEYKPRPSAVAPPSRKERRKKKRRNRKNIVSLCILLCCAIVFVTCGVILLAELRAYQVGSDSYESVAGEAIQAAPAGSELPITVDFNALRQQNSDIIGWLYSADTVINYPIVQNSDNEYYLTHLFDGTTNKNGCLFADYRNAGDFSDPNTFIYGHHMRNGTMFASLVKYKEQAYYDAHPIMYLLTPDANYRVELFAGYVTDPLNSVYTLGFADAAQFLSYTTTAKASSTFTNDVVLTPEDHVIVLSTCTYEFNDARYVVLGKLVEVQ